MGVTNSIEYNASNYMDAAFAPVELAFKQAVQKDTWGHLAPRRNKTYHGYIVFSITCYGNMEVIDTDFKGLDGGPWLYDAIQEFVFQDWKELREGAIFRWDGTFRNYKFRGLRNTLYDPSAASTNS
jgi:hypothetical protein